MLLSVLLCARTLIFSFLFKIIWFHDFLPVIFSSYLHCLYYYYCVFVNACFVTRKVRWRIISEEQVRACPRLVLWLGSVSSPLPFGCVARIMQILHRAPIGMYNVWCFLFSEFNCFFLRRHSGDVFITLRTVLPSLLTEFLENSAEAIARCCRKHRRLNNKSLSYIKWETMI